MTIVEFLLARIADDEEAARQAQAVTAAEWVANGSVLMHIADPATRLAEATAIVEDCRMDDAWRHAERHDPARVLAECQAKRAIILRYQNSHAAYTDNPRDEFASITSAALFWAIVDLAVVYADHPAYQEEWRP